MRLFYIIFVLFLFSSCASSYSISSKLSEISGIENPYKGMFFAINDSGDEPIVYLMTSNGVVFHKILGYNTKDFF